MSYQRLTAYGNEDMTPRRTRGYLPEIEFRKECLIGISNSHYSTMIVI